MNEDQLIAAIRQRASNPATRTDFADRGHGELGPPASANAIEAAERKMGCHLHQLHRRLFKEVGNGGFGPGDGLIGIPGGSLDVEQRSVIELRQVLFSDHETPQGSGNSGAPRRTGSLLIKGMRGLARRFALATLSPVAMWSVVPLCDWGCGIWSCVDCGTGTILSISEFGLRDLEQGLHSWFEDWTSGVNLWERMVVVDEFKIKHPRTGQWVVGRKVTGMRGKIWSGERRAATRHS